MSDPADPTAERSANRRDLLKRLAIVGGAGVVAPMLTSTSALADSGTVKCRYTNSSTVQASYSITRSGTTEFVQFSTRPTAPTGTCPCGGTPLVRYAYYVEFVGVNAPGTASSNGFTLTAVTFPSQINVPFTAGGPGNNPWNFDVQLGVAIRCNGVGATQAMVCRFARRTGATNNSNPPRAPGSGNFTDPFTLTSVPDIICPTSL